MNIRLVSIGSDRKIFNEHSAVSKRMVEYGDLLGELHIVIFSLRSSGLEAKKIAPNVWLYPTNSASRLLFVFDAIRIGKKILSTLYFGQTALTVQDPFESGLVGVILRAFSRVPLQTQLHTDAWSYHFRYQNLLNWIRVSLLAPLVLKRSDGVRVVSEKIRRDVILHGNVAPATVLVLPIFVDIDVFARLSPGRDLHGAYPQWQTIILMASRLTKEKNIDLALKALKRLIPTYPSLGMVIVGSGPEGVRLKRMVKRLKLGGNVAFEDWQMDLRSYFQTADIFLNTSLYEGYGMTLIEAGASRRPVVTTRVGVGYDLLEDGRNALVCGVGDRDCIYTKLRTLMENPLIRKSLGTEIQKNVLALAVSREEYLERFRKQFDMLFT